MGGSDRMYGGPVKVHANIEPSKKVDSEQVQSINITKSRVFKIF